VITWEIASFRIFTGMVALDTDIFASWFLVSVSCEVLKGRQSPSPTGSCSYTWLLSPFYTKHHQALESGQLSQINDFFGKGNRFHDKTTDNHRGKKKKATLTILNMRQSATKIHDE
jgi:hypothetical protein